MIRDATNLVKRRLTRTMNALQRVFEQDGLCHDCILSVVALRVASPRCESSFLLSSPSL